MAAFVLPTSNLPYEIEDIDGQVWRLIEAGETETVEENWYGPTRWSDCQCYWYADNHEEGVRLLAGVREDVLPCAHVLASDTAGMVRPFIRYDSGQPYYTVPDNYPVASVAWILAPFGVKETVVEFTLRAVRDLATEMGTEHVLFEDEKLQQEAENNPQIAELLGW